MVVGIWLGKCPPSLNCMLQKIPEIVGSMTNFGTSFGPDYQNQEGHGISSKTISHLSLE